MKVINGFTEIEATEEIKSKMFLCTRSKRSSCNSLLLVGILVSSDSYKNRVKDFINLENIFN